MRVVLYSLFVSALLSSCATHQTNLDEFGIDEALVGDWGWTKELCETTPDQIQFSDDGKTVEMQLGRPRKSKINGETIDHFTFKIIDLEERSIKTVTENYPPDSKQENGIYHLKLVSENRMCIIHNDDDRPCRNFLKRCTAI